MTAAVAPPAPPLTHDPRTSRIAQVNGPRVVLPGSKPRNRTPYLAPVPSSEPPFDDERPVGLDGSAATDRPVADVRVEVAPTVPAQRTAVARRSTSGSTATLNPGTLSSAAFSSGTRSSGSGTVAARNLATRSGSISTSSAGSAGILPMGTALETEKRSGGAGPTTIAAVDVPTWSSEADIGVRRTATEHLPPARRAASVLARALVEVLSSRRPVAQLRVHCAPDIYAGLLERPFAGHQALPHLMNVRVCEPADGVAEVSAVFRRADRVRAIAFRIQGVDGRWRITALQLG